MLDQPRSERGLVILDRDGTINYDSADYIRGPAEWQALPGSVEAIAALCAAGFIVAVATNQSGIGRGYFDRDGLRATHRKMRRAVARAGGRIARIEYCPHLPGAGCRCRKPRPGLIERLVARFGVARDRVWMIGDSAKDIGAARAAGVRPLLVMTGNGADARAAAALDERWVFDDLAAAARAIIERAGD